MSGVDNNPVCVEGLRFNFLVFNQYVLINMSAGSREGYAVFGVSLRVGESF